jgi:hypothetical protein
MAATVQPIGQGVLFKIQGHKGEVAGELEV